MVPIWLSMSQPTVKIPELMIKFKMINDHFEIDHLWLYCDDQRYEAISPASPFATGSEDEHDGAAKWVLA